MVVKDRNGRSIVVGTRVRRAQRSRRERNVRNGYYDVGTVEHVHDQGMWRTVRNQFGNPVEVWDTNPHARVTWDDGRNTTSKVSRLIAVEGE